MAEKIVSQLDAQGYFIGAVVADPSPLEPDVFLIPGGAVDADPPTLPEGKRARWNGTGFTIEDIPVPPAPEPDPVVPEGPPTVVTMRQARLALLQVGLLTQVNTAVAAMPGAQGDAARIEWEFSSTVERNRPLVQALGAALGLTDAQLDDLFRLAATL